MMRENVNNKGKYGNSDNVSFVIMQMFCNNTLIFLLLQEALPCGNLFWEIFRIFKILIVNF